MAYLDLSDANISSTVVASYTKPHETAYSIILPDNWTLDDMAGFVDNANKGSLAAVYSYSGTQLNVMEITDGSYNTEDLKDPRIVRAGTTAIEVRGVLKETDSETYKPYGGLGANLITALNQADDAPDNDAVNNIKTITINIGQASAWDGATITLTNTNITTLSLAGIQDSYNPNTGPAVIVTGCSNLQTLNVSGATLRSLSAAGIASLTTVDMGGTLMTTYNSSTAEVNLSTTGLTTLTTTNTTTFNGTLNLAGTALTSFSTTAKVAGDINLNACASLANINISTTQFQNSTSKIHVHKTDDESDTNVLEKLNKDGERTIQIPNEFDKTRIHPNDGTNDNPLDDNISETAKSGSMVLTDECKIAYDADKGIVTVTAAHPGCFSKLMAQDGNYDKFPAGTTFKFDSSCQLNENDLKALAGYISEDGANVNDMAYRSNYYYVDLFDMAATEGLCNNETGVIYKTIEWMRENNRQFRGLILPKDHTQYGSGTTLIQDRAVDADDPLATCSEFIAYYKTKDESGEAIDKKLLVAHVYNAMTSKPEIGQQNYDVMKAMLDAHTEIADNADIYSISTNTISAINLAGLPAEGKTRIEVFNNEMVGAKPAKGATILVTPAAAGAFATAAKPGATGLANTPTELLQITGAINADDIAAINTFTSGPRVLDLRYVTSEITPELIAAIENKDIEYLLLPESMAKKNAVSKLTYSDKMTALKCVIASTNSELVAYVKQPGSLAEARYYATGGSYDEATGIYTPAITGLTKATIMGQLNAADIAQNTASKKVDASGHWSDKDKNKVSIAFPSESTLANLDLSDAVFDDHDGTGYDDMHFSYAGLLLTHVDLPTATEMAIIPTNCFEGIASLQDICIPYNYTTIKNGAFLNTQVEHITTTDRNGALIDNGPNTYTLSANVQEIGENPGYEEDGTPKVLNENQTVFPQNRPVKETYILATKTPKCYAGAFPANMVNGWGGFDGAMPYCRDKYNNSGNWYCVLRFPSQESYDAATSEAKDASYGLMKQQYTDVNKIYTKLEQTGAVDANGESILWPTFSETQRVYHQATKGLTWVDWETGYNGQQEVNTDKDLTSDYEKVEVPGTDYDFKGYEGWHQFVLSQATYVAPAQTVQEETKKVVRDYTLAGWYTICIPYDLTKEQVINWLGVPASDDNYISTIDGTQQETAVAPDIRQLVSVERKNGNGTTNNVVTFRLSENLYNGGASQYYTFDHTQEAGAEASKVSAAGTGDLSEVCMRGGHPYLVQIYRRSNETIPSWNIGKYIMTHYADKFQEKFSCIEHGEYEQLGDGNKKTLQFARPYEDHKVTAVDDKKPAHTLNYDDEGTDRRYHYALVGQFWDQPLPLYCIYQSQGTWYRNTVTKWTWQAFKCVIMAVPYADYSGEATFTGHVGGYYRKNGAGEGVSVYPEVQEGTDDKLNKEFQLVFLDGRDDAVFPTAENAKYTFVFDEAITDIDEQGNATTVIESLDGEAVPTSRIDDGRIYNMAGQYVGTDMSRLGKGIYLVGGKKYIVK